MTIGKSVTATEEKEVKMANENEVLCKQFVRGISKQNITVPDMNMWTVQEVDAYVSEWMKRGYKLVGSPVFMGEIPDGAYMYLYTMTKDV